MRRIAMVALAMTMAGCSTLDATGPSGSVEGTYSLVRLDGSPLPYTFSNGLTLIADDLTLYRDGTYTDISRYSTGRSNTDQGYYSNSSGSLNFQSSTSNLVSQGSVSGRVLTQFIGGFTQTFQRQ